MGKAKDITVVTYKQGNGGQAMTSVDAKQLAALKATGRLVQIHEQK